MELIEQFERVSISPKISGVFLNEINYVCETIIQIYINHNYIYEDVLDILSHCGNNLACNYSDSFEEDIKWLNQYGKVYIFNYITSKLNLSPENFNKIHNIFNKVKELYEI